MTSSMAVSPPSLIVKDARRSASGGSVRCIRPLTEAVTIGAPLSIAHRAARRFCSIWRETASDS